MRGYIVTDLRNIRVGVTLGYSESHIMYVGCFVVMAWVCAMMVQLQHSELHELETKTVVNLVSYLEQAAKRPSAAYCKDVHLVYTKDKVVASPYCILKPFCQGNCGKSKERSKTCPLKRVGERAVQQSWEQPTRL